MTNFSGHSTYAEAIAYLYNRINYEQAPPGPSRKVDLQPMRMLLSRLGNPEQRIPVVHIAGTKGKGSTAGMISNMLTESGFRAGLYTSPHLSRLEERFVVAGQQCSPEELVEMTWDVRKVVDEVDEELSTSYGRRGLTFFEITTAMMWCHFLRRKVDVAVVEVGMGGRLDSTNLCRPLVTVITSISLDHTRQLGNSLTAIAGEKAGIIKQHIPVVSGVQDPEPAKIIAQVAEQNSAPLYRLGLHFHVRRRSRSPHAAGHIADSLRATNQPDVQQVPVSVSGNGRLRSYANLFDYVEDVGGSRRTLEDLEVALPGPHQIANAAVAIAAVGCLRTTAWHVTDDAVRRSLAGVRCRGRIEIVSRHPTVVLDTAHNVASIAALVETVQEGFSAENRVVIFAASRDKDVPGMLRLLAAHFDTLILTRFFSNQRSMAPEQLARIVAEIQQETTARCRSVRTCASPAEAWQYCQSILGRDDFACITGSFFLAAELDPIVRSANRLPTPIP